MDEVKDEGKAGGGGGGGLIHSFTAQEEPFIQRDTSSVSSQRSMNGS